MRKRRKVGGSAKNNMPTIMTAVSIVTMGLALYFTGTGTAKSVEDVRKRKEELGVDKLPFKEKVRVCWKNYIPAAAATSVSIGTSIASEVGHQSKEKILTSALLASNESIKLIRKEVTEKIGEDGMKEIVQKVAEETPVVEDKKNKQQALTDGDYIVVYDEFSGFKFNTTMPKLTDAEFEANRELNHNDGGWTRGEVEFADFFRWMGAKPPLFMLQYKWDSSSMWDEFDTAWIDFIHEETKDVNGARMIILRYSIQPGVKGKEYID